MCQLPGRTTKDSKVNKKEKFANDFLNLWNSGITDILCLLNKHELRSAGLEISDY